MNLAASLNRNLHRAFNVMARIYLGWNKYDFSADDSFKSASIAPYRSVGILQTIRALAKVKSNNYTFYDIGCGKGNILILADMFDFKKIIGLELHDELAKIGIKNIKKYQNINGKRSNIYIEINDATKYKYADERSIFYFFNPVSKEIFEMIIEQIDKSLVNSEFFLLIIHPVSGAYIDLLNKKNFEKVLEIDHLFSRSIIFKSPKKGI